MRAYEVTKSIEGLTPLKPATDLASWVARTLPGTTIGEYVVEGLIGVGGMGAVFKGRQPQIGKEVAVKVLLSPPEDRETAERFLAEARAVNAIRHRGIIDIFSFGRLPSGQLYFVMELLQGRPFDALTSPAKPVPAEVALGWVEEICDALHAAHQCSVIHRDIKPSNLFLVEPTHGAPYVKLLDFGIAVRRGGPGDDQVVMGTPHYMPPEQSGGGPIGPAADVYALGCVLFELLTGTKAFEAPDPIDLMTQHVVGPVPLPSQRTVHVPRQVDQLVAWALQKRAGDRPASAAQFGAACRAVRQGLMRARLAAPTPPPPPPRPRPPQRTVTPPLLSKPLVHLPPMVEPQPSTRVLKSAVARSQASSRLTQACGVLGVLAALGAVLSFGMNVSQAVPHAPAPVVAPQDPVPERAPGPSHLEHSPENAAPTAVAGLESRIDS